MLQIPRVLRPIVVDCDKPKATKNSHYNEKDFYIALLTALLQEAK